MTQTFYFWMMEFRDEDSARGDLARDMKWDGSKNLYNLKRKGMMKRLRKKGACRDAVTTFERCYQQYLDYFGLFVEGSKDEKNVQLAKRFGEPIGHIRGTPILQGIKRLDWSEGWRVFCKFCLRWHLHGKTEKINLGHRVAHCTSHNATYGDMQESQYVKYGYYLLTDPVARTEKTGKIYSEDTPRTRIFFEDYEK